MQAAIAEQQGLGWGGRPLHPAGYVDQQQHMRVAMPEFSPNRVPSPVAGAGFRQQQQQQQPHPQQQHHGNAHRNNHRNGHQQGNHNGYNRNNHGHNQGGNCHGPRGGNGRGPARANSGNGGGSGDPRGHKGQSYRRLWQQVTCVNRGGHLGGGDATFRETTVEDLLEVVRHLPPEASAVKAVAQGLYFLDSGALAALLKELNKAGHSRRAQEIFDWLRALEPTHDLYGLCNTMTYTTMISQCGTQQALRRALELVAEMRGRGVQCNVHTYSALMNVCIKGEALLKNT